jgi:predicted O-methyltransferase YrrM
MAELQARDAADRVDGTPHGARLRAIAPEVGQFLLTLAVATGAVTIVEVGTSSGY